MTISALLAIASQAQDVPLFPRDGKQNTDWGALNQNNADLASRNRDRTTGTLTPQSCPAGQALTGAFYNRSGATAGGICTAIPGASGVSTTTVFTTNMAFQSSATFNGPAIFNQAVSGTYNVICSSNSASQTGITSGTGVWIGVTGSSITITIQANKRVHLHGLISLDPINGGLNTILDCLLLQGGTPLGKEGVWGTGSGSAVLQGANLSIACPMDWTTAALAAGTYTFSSMVSFQGSGVGSIIPSELPWQICAEEIR